MRVDTVQTRTDYRQHPSVQTSSAYDSNVHVAAGEQDECAEEKQGAPDLAAAAYAEARKEMHAREEHLAKPLTHEELVDTTNKMSIGDPAGSAHALSDTQIAEMRAFLLASR